MAVEQSNIAVYDRSNIVQIKSLIFHNDCRSKLEIYSLFFSFSLIVPVFFFDCLLIVNCSLYCSCLCLFVARCRKRRKLCLLRATKVMKFFSHTYIPTRFKGMSTDWKIYNESRDQLCYSQFSMFYSLEIILIYLNVHGDHVTHIFLSINKQMLNVTCFNDSFMNKYSSKG